MESEGFTTEERAHHTASTFAILRRFLREVPFYRRALVPIALLSAIASGAHQLIIWMAGRYAECSDATDCSVPEALRGFGITVSIGALFVLVAISFSSRLVLWVSFEACGPFSSLPLFRRMVGRLGRTRTSFFDEYPSGKIINRLTGDAERVRVDLPIVLEDSIISLTEFFAIVGVVSFASPFAALPAIPILLLFLFIQTNTAPMLQHLNMLRSARFGEVLHRESDIIEGVRCFDLYNELPTLLGRFSRATYRYMQMHFLRGQVQMLGRLWCDIAVACYGAIVLCAVSIAIHQGVITAALGAVIISATFRVGGLLAWLSNSLVNLYEGLGIARRVFEYTDLPPETAEEGNIPACAAPTDRVLDGDLIFSNYSMSYRASTPQILTNLSMRISRGSKVGLVGRTGAGKSSVVQSLFRMVYVHGGDIAIGGQSLLALPIEQARANFAIVPQEPYLFEGTIRSNLDRCNHLSDEVLLRTLEAVNLTFNLACPVTEGGANLSFGERQLICLARVIVANCPFVIMDEPTSGVDSITDAIIQSVLRSALADRTIITIAHRLETLAGMDRIIEFAGGEIVRDGAPEEVLPLLSVEELAG
jgi:ATP-binding cassette subfamily C (CFTR/MRP) protein 1